MKIDPQRLDEESLVLSLDDVRKTAHRSGVLGQ